LGDLYVFFHAYHITLGGALHLELTIPRHTFSHIE